MLLLLLLPVGLFAQQEEKPMPKAQRHREAMIATERTDSVAVADTTELAALPLVVPDSVLTDSVPRFDAKRVWIPDPNKAVWLATLFPGAGQIYNRKYWKLPIYYGGFVACTYALTWNSRMYKDYSQAYQDIMSNTNLIAAARVTKELPDGAYDPENIGNGLNMDLVLDLKTEKLDSLASTPGGAPASLNEYLTNTVSSVGNAISNIDNKAATQQDVLSQIDNQRVSLYGVNLNEEVTDLIKYQRAYEAAARVFNVTNQMMQILTSLGE